MFRITKFFVFTAWAIFCCASLFIITDSVTPSVEASALVIKGPAEIYAANCAQCHGSDGKARTAKGKRAGATDFTTSDWNADEARGIRIITNGRSEMPSFKKKLTANEIRSVFRYVLKFRP